jgi:cleavage stimulation factor subunit 3
MAGEDAEIALLHQMQAGQESVAWADGGENGAAGAELPSNTENNEQVKKEDSVADDQVLRALSPPGADAVSDGGDYDPSSVTSLPAVTVAGLEDDSRSSSRASSRKPKTVGGFIADDSDEEYDASTPQPTPNTNRAIPPSPLQNSISQQDLQNQDDSHPTIPVNLSVTAGSVPVQSPAQMRTFTAAAASAPPKARLPNDRTGILEDRIKEDPRGDLEAWFSLITEHRNRNKLDDARAVYERFFKIFPQAVSSSA